MTIYQVNFERGISQPA